jgi:hypothetical protein
MSRTARDIMKEALATGKITPETDELKCPSYAELRARDLENPS